MSDYEEYAADEKRDEMRDDRLIHRNAGNQPESREKPLQPVKNDDERIREAFQKQDLSDYLTRDKPVRNMAIKTKLLVGFELGFKSRDEQCFQIFQDFRDERAALRAQNDEILAALDTTIEERDEYSKEIDELKEQIEEMKCCGNCYTYFDSIDNCGEYNSEAGVCDNWKRRSE